MNTAAPVWGTDAALFASLPGGQAIIDWFGFCPDFHDAILERLELSHGRATLTLRAFRMTDQIDRARFFVLDRHATLILHM